MAAGVTIKHKRKATAFVPASDLVAGEIGINTGTPRIEFSPDGTNNYIIAPANDTAYDATSWDGSLDAPTKNAVRDKIEALSVGGGITEAKAIAYAVALGG